MNKTGKRSFAIEAEKYAPFLWIGGPFPHPLQVHSDRRVKDRQSCDCISFLDSHFIHLPECSRWQAGR